MQFRKLCGAARQTSVAAVLTLTLILLLGSSAAAAGYKVLHEFGNGSDGWLPSTALILDAGGNLYGTTEYGGAYGAGTVYKLTPNDDGSWAESVIYSFTGGADGGHPYLASLLFDAAGNLYGTTGGGGLGSCYVFGSGCGTVFRLTPSQNGSWTESVLYSFSGGADGAYPLAGLIFDSTGSLYSTAIRGGSTRCTDGCGVAFKLTPNADGTWSETILHKFAGGGDGIRPNSPLIFDSAGNLYGTTVGDLVNGCSTSCGTVFKLSPNPDGTWIKTTVHRFTGPDGSYPFFGLTFDAAGNLYGGAGYGGAFGYGVAFTLAPQTNGGWQEKILHEFQGGPWDGAVGPSALIFDSSGNLYGTTDFGGKGDCSYNGISGCGTVVKLTPAGGWRWRSTVLHRFSNSPAANPISGLVLDAVGNLYGTTANIYVGGYGVVFTITP